MGTTTPRLAGLLCLGFALAASPMAAEPANAANTLTPTPDSMPEAAFAAKKAKPKAAGKAPARPPFPTASVAINGETGEILACDQCHELRAPASLAKLVTAMVGFDAVNAGKFKLTDSFALASATRVSAQGAVTLAARGVPAGTMVTVDNLFSAIAVTSAADATYTLSTAVCGTETCIVDLMNAKVDAILNDPMAKTNFTNPHGMPGKGQITTAYEMAMIMRYMMKNYPGQWHYFGQTSYTVGKVKFYGHNRLLVDYKCDNALKLPYNCMEAGKTGFFRNPGKDQGPPAGFSIAGSAAWNGYRVVAVRMGDTTAAIRNGNLRRLFDNGFRKLETSGAPKTVPMPLHFPNLFPPHIDPEEERTHVSPSPVLPPPSATPGAAR